MRAGVLFALLLSIVGSVRSELIQHLDAADQGSVTTDGSGIVSQWADQTTNGNHAIPSAGSVYYPSDSKSPMDLAGLDFGTDRNSLELFTAAESDSWLDFTGDALGNSGFCVLIAFKCDGLISNWSDLLGNSSAVSSGFGIRYSSSGGYQVYLNGNLGIGGTAAAGDTIVMALNYDANSGNWQWWDSKNDGDQSGSKIAGDFSSSSAVTIGSATSSSRFINGMVGEVKVFDTFLSASELLTEEDALVSKWIAEIIEDTDAPVPNPATWASEPNVTGPFSIVMTATTGTDASGVEYLFTETSGNPGGASSGWQTVPTYRNDGLTPETQYSYTVTMRDMIGNVGTASVVANATTPEIGPGRTDGPPNVVIIYADDLGNADISRNAPAGSLCYTPNIDRICNNGIYLSNYMTHHVCSPSRAGLLTGRHYARVGAGVETGGTLDNSIPNIAKDFKAAGYATGCFGKWHNGSHPYSDDGSMVEVSSLSQIITDDLILQYTSGESFGEGVNAYGFDEWAGYYGGGFNYHTRVDARDINWWINGVYSAYVTGYNTYIIRDNAMNFIASHASEPFFLYVPMEAVHGPYDILNTDLEEMCNIVDDANSLLAWSSVKELVSPTTGRKIGDVLQMRCSGGNEFDKDALDGTLPGFAKLVYYTLDYALDKATGDILNQLEEYGLTSNTIVAFASDNGGTLSGDNTPFSGSKHTLWEGGVHVPAAIWWPGTLDSDTSPYSVGDNDYTYLAQYIDWYPTLIAMAGQTLNGTDLDGLNLYPSLQTRTPRRTGFENCYYGLDDSWAAIKNNRWKLHFNRVPGDKQMLELYDLQNDIGESVNVESIYPAERDTLIALMDEWFATDIISTSYMPLTGESIPPYIVPAPSGEILEVTATQTDSLSNPASQGVYIRYADPDMGEFSEPYNGYVHSGDTFEYDIYVAADSDQISGFFCSPAFGTTPRFGTTRGVNIDGNLVAEQILPKGQWVRQSTGMGEIAANSSYSSYIGLLNSSPGYYHFYIDNVVTRKNDGSVRAIAWDNAADTRSSFRYLRGGTSYSSWSSAVASPGFPFSDITFTTVDVNVLPADTTPPLAPTSLTAISGISSVSLDWDGLTGLGSYNVYRSLTSGSYATAIATGIQTSEYLDNTASDGTTYHYVVTAVDTSGNESGYSNEDSALPPDLNDDDRIDLEDVAEAAGLWLTTYVITDLSVIAENWLIN